MFGLSEKEHCKLCVVIKEFILTVAIIFSSEWPILAMTPWKLLMEKIFKLGHLQTFSVSCPEHIY